MLKRSKKNYVHLQDVRVFHDKNTDIISITSKDKRLAKEFGGFKLNLTSGRQNELALRKLLRQEGVISEEHVTPKDLETMLFYPGSEHRDWYEIPLGRTVSQELFWNVKIEPHALISGTTGAGKSVIQRNIIFHCIQHSDRWRFLGIDLKRVELAPYLKYEPTVMGIATTIEDSLEVLRYANQEMSNRYTEMVEVGVNNFRDLDSPPYALMIMIDEAYSLLGLTGLKTDEGKAQDALKSEASAILGDIARLGRAAGVHLSISTQRPDATIIYGELKQNLAARIAAGRADTIASHLTLDNDNATKLAPVKGRGYFQSFGHGEEFQGYYSEQDWMDRWLESKKGS